MLNAKKAKKNLSFCMPKIFQPKSYVIKSVSILLNSSIITEKALKLNFFIVFKKSNNFLINIIFGLTPYIGVNYLISVSASFEAFREVRGDFPFMVIQKRPQKFNL